MVSPTAAIIQMARIAAVIALMGVAAAISTPKGRLPLVLRGLAKTMGRPVSLAKGEPVPLSKRLLALFLVLVAMVLALI